MKGDWELARQDRERGAKTHHGDDLTQMLVAHVEALLEINDVGDDFLLLFAQEITSCASERPYSTFIETCERTRETRYRSFARCYAHLAELQTRHGPWARLGRL